MHLRCVRLRATLQRWPGASGSAAGAPPPADSVDGLRPPTLPTGASAPSPRSGVSRLGICQGASESPHFGARKIPHFGGGW